MTSAKRKLIQDAVAALPPAVRNASGSVLYSGWSSVAAGPVYLMGLNPGGDPADSSAPNVGRSLDQLADRYSAYADESWTTGSGESRHQKHVLHLLDQLHLSTYETLSANAIFVRSKDTAKLRDVEGIASAWIAADMCWPVHQVLLSIVRPRAIVCLGNGEGTTSWGMLRHRLKSSGAGSWSSESETADFRAGKAARASVTLGVETLECAVVGLAHPSYHAPSPEAIDLVRSFL